jgi:KaiC
MSERLSSGHPRLDGVLGGGLPANGINLLIGLPGTGKTILAQQYVFTNATPERPALYLATVSEPFDKILRYGQELGFFDRNAVGRSVFYEDLGTLLNEGGLAAVLEQVSTLIKERRPGIIVRSRRRFPQLSSRPCQSPLRLPRLLSLGRRVRRGRDLDGARVRRRRHDHRPLDDARGRARDPLAPRPQAEGKRFRSGLACLPRDRERPRRVPAARRSRRHHRLRSRPGSAVIGSRRSGRDAR